MTTVENPIWATLDVFHADLSSRGPREALGRLVDSLARDRAHLPGEVWRDACHAIDSHPALARLLEDPYSRDARTKPAGYAGDARTLDYVYLQDPGTPRLTPGGRALFDLATSVPIAAAVRDRSTTLAGIVAARARSGSVSVASIACGHARELDHVPADLKGDVQYWGVDQDAASIEHCRRRNLAGMTTMECGSVRDILIGRIRIPASDLVYASGLFDYLEERAAAVLIKRMYASVKPGGVVLVPNLSPRNQEVGYMEAVMDWWMVYRTEADMQRLALSAGFDCEGSRATTFSTSDGRVAWLRLERLA